MRLPEPRILLITDRHQARAPLEEIAQAALAGGCRWLLLRDRDLPRDERIALCRSLLSAASYFGATVLMGGDPSVAAAAGAAGVHLPRDGDPLAAREDLGETAIIGVSAHDLTEARRAAAAGADYVTLSPVFESASKPGYGPALGLDSLAAVVRAVELPVLALGGVTAERASACLEAGASGLAVMGEVMRPKTPRPPWPASSRPSKASPPRRRRAPPEVPGRPCIQRVSGSRARRLIGLDSPGPKDYMLRRKIHAPRRGCGAHL